MCFKLLAIKKKKNNNTNLGQKGPFQDRRKWLHLEIISIKCRSVNHLIVFTAESLRDVCRYSHKPRWHSPTRKRRCVCLEAENEAAPQRGARRATITPAFICISTTQLRGC